MRKRESNLVLYEQLTRNSSKPIQIPKQKPSKSKLLPLSGRSPNFFRVGCPTENLIHIPHHVAVLNKKSTTNLAVSKLSIKDLINTNATKMTEPKPIAINQIWDLFDSIKVPISNFSEIKLPKPFFSIDSGRYDKEKLEEIKLNQKINNEKYLKPLSIQAENIKNTIKTEKPNENSFISPFLKDPKLFLK